MDDSIFSQNKDFLNSLITENNDIGIVIGEPHSLDKIAGALSLYLAFESLGKSIQIVSSKDPIVEFSNLVGIDKIKKDFTGEMKLFTIAFPYREGEIEKVSYNIEGNRLNINLFAGEQKISFSEKDVEYIKKGSTPSLIFAIGVSNSDRFLNSFDPNQSVKIVNINNSGNNLFGDVALVNPSFSSISEMIVKIIQDLSLPVDIDVAQNLMDGVSSATNNLSSFSTSPAAFEATSFLLRNGAKRRNPRSDVNKRRNMPEERFQNQPQQNNQVRQSFNQQRQDRGSQQPYNQPVNQPSQSFNPANRVNQPAQQTNQPVQTSQSSQTNRPDIKDLIDDSVPEDWFAPKVFKGSQDPKDQF